MIVFKYLVIITFFAFGFYQINQNINMIEKNCYLEKKTLSFLNESEYQSIVELSMLERKSLWPIKGQIEVVSLSWTPKEIKKKEVNLVNLDYFNHNYIRVDCNFPKKEFTLNYGN